MCEQRTEHPPDRTVRVDRRSRGRSSRRSWPGTSALRQRADHLGGGPDAAGLSLRTPLDPTHPQRSPVAGDVPLPAGTVGLPQAAEKRPPVAVQSDSHPGRLLPILVRRVVDDRCHPGALRHVTGDGATIRSGRTRWLWLLRLPFPLVLGHEALPGVHRRRDAHHVVPGQPQARGTRGGGRPAGAQPPPHPYRADPSR
jgi:hypothetical protein